MRAKPLLFGLFTGLLFLAPMPTQAGEKETDKKAEKAEGKPLRFEGELTNKDEKNPARPNSFQKVHKVELQSGKAYRIDLVSNDFDSYLRLESGDGKRITEDDDGGGFPHARIVHEPKADGEFRVIVTTFEPNKTGKYTLTVTQADKADLLASKVAQLPRLNAAEQREVVDEYKKHLETQGKKLDFKEAIQAMRVASALEYGPNKDLAAETYAEFGRLLSKSEEEKVTDLAQRFEGASRRLKLPGNEIKVHGQTLEGKDFDWKEYRGKVVLVDFWAVWCGPCRAEMPRIKKMYEAYYDRGFDVVAISLDNTREAPIKYMEKEKLPWVSLFDKEPGEGRQPLADYYGVMAIPQAILVDREGKVISMQARGAELDRLLEKHIGPLEKEKTDKGAK